MILRREKTLLPKKKTTISLNEEKVKRLIKSYFPVSLFVSLFAFSNAGKIQLWLISFTIQQSVLEIIISNNIKISSCLAKAKLRFTSSKATNADLCFSRKGSHTQIHYVIISLKSFLFNRLTSQNASNRLFRLRIVTKFDFSKIIFTDDKIRWNSKWIGFRSLHLIHYTLFYKNKVYRRIEAETYFSSKHILGWKQLWSIDGSA